MTEQTEQWPLNVSCNGISCGACGRVIVAKNVGRKSMPTDISVLGKAIEKHIPECSTTKAAEARDVRMAARRQERVL